MNRNNLCARGVLTMATITKKDLIDRIARGTGQRRSVVKTTVQALLEEMILELGKGNRLEFRDFGVFEIKERAPRVAQNPKTLERVHVPAKQTVKFKVGRMMRKSIDNVEDVAGDIGVSVLVRDNEELASPAAERAAGNGRHISIDRSVAR